MCPEGERAGPRVVVIFPETCSTANDCTASSQLLTDLKRTIPCRIVRSRGNANVSLAGFLFYGGLAE